MWERECYFCSVWNWLFRKKFSQISVWIFSQRGEANWREIIIYVIKKMSQHSFFELFTWNTKAPFTFAITPIEVSITILQYRRKKVIFSTFQTFIFLTKYQQFQFVNDIDFRSWIFSLWRHSFIIYISWFFLWIVDSWIKVLNLSRNWF